MFVKGTKFVYKKNKTGIVLDSTTEGVKVRFDNGEEKTYSLSTVKSDFKKVPTIETVSPTSETKPKDTLEKLDETIDRLLYEQILAKMDMLKQLEYSIMELSNRKLEILEQENQLLKEKLEHKNKPAPIKKPVGKPPRFTPEQIDEMKAYRMQGKSCREIGAIFGCSDVYVCRITKK